MTEICALWFSKLNLVPCHTKSPASLPRCVSLNLRWWGIWAGAGLFPKTLHPLDLDLRLNTMHLALCESGLATAKRANIAALKASELLQSRHSVNLEEVLPSCFLPICLFHIIIPLLLLMKSERGRRSFCFNCLLQWLSAVSQWFALVLYPPLVFDLLPLPLLS